MIKNWRWWISRKFRQAADLRKQVWYIQNSQRDQLPDNALHALDEGLVRFDAAYRQAGNAAAAIQAADALEEVAAKWLQPYPNASARENLKEFLVSGVFILTVFTFFIQPMKIPSGSAQPTLYGNVVYDLRADNTPLPGRLTRLVDWFRGFGYHEWVAGDSGELQVFDERRSFGFLRSRTVRIGSDTYTFYWPPDQLTNTLSGLAGQHFNRGDLVFRLKIQSGDRLFVDRMTYHFRRPHRGEVIVFSSVDIDPTLRVYRGGRVLMENTHYIKRLVGLGGDRVQIGDDRHVRINGKRLDKTTPHFEKVYDFKGAPKDSVYSGHVNDKVARQFGRAGLAPLFPDGNAVLTVRPKHYLAFGDNTMNSFDGRAWGDFPRTQVTGRALFVFWPFTARFGPVEWW